MIVVDKDNLISYNKPCFIIAEISANHSQSLDRAVRLIKKAKECGADAVKFQAYTPDTLTIDCDNKYFRIRHPRWGGQTLYQLYKKSYTPWSWFKKLKKTADDANILFFATAFDRSSVDLLEELRVPLHKIASFELVDLPLVRYAARTGKPLILSTGMTTCSEIKEAAMTAKKGGAKEIILLKCVSSYPAKPEEMNLKCIPHMEKMFKCPIGLSDHSMGIAVSITAVTMGARLIEKHFTLSRRIKTPDSFFSIEPSELKNLVKNIRISEEAVGSVSYGLTEEEKRNRVFRRSLFTLRTIRAGEIITEENIGSIRPGYGLAPKHFKDMIGKIAKADINKGTPLGWKLVKEA